MLSSVKQQRLSSAYNATVKRLRIHGGRKESCCQSGRSMSAGRKVDVECDTGGPGNSKRTTCLHTSRFRSGQDETRLATNNAESTFEDQGYSPQKTVGRAFPLHRVKGGVCSLTLGLILSLSVLPQLTGAADVLFFVPVYEWTLVWKDWRNPNYKMGSIWRPKMIANFNRSDFPSELNRRIDGYDIREYVSDKFDVVYFGDVFMQGHGAASFPLFVTCFRLWLVTSSYKLFCVRLSTFSQSLQTSVAGSYNF